MFGYVTVCQNGLSEQSLKTFKAYYCGLCKTIGRRCSQSARLGLSYDITFLAIVLSSVCKNEISMKDKKCVLHPVRENICVEADMALNYAADMGVILTYLKLLDDWNDDRSIKALFSMLLFANGVRKSKKHYSREYESIRKCLDELSQLEKNNCKEIDETADCFARILEILFTPDFIKDESTKRILAWLGYNIGRWIYIVDAYNDLEKDVKKDDYNTFKAKYDGKTVQEIKVAIREDLCTSMTFTLENAASAYNLLEIYKNKDILDNIIYVALKAKQRSILGENDESL